MRGINLLNKHGIEWNAMAVVNDFNGDYPLDFYHFFKDISCKYIQFTPIVERIRQHEDGRILASPDEESIDGERCMIQKYKDFGFVEEKRFATEGIGFNYGMLPAMDGVVIYSNGTFPLIRLNRVYNGKGEVIYRGYDKTLGVNDMTADYSGLEIRMTEDAISVTAEGNVGVTVWSMQGSKVACAEGAGEVSVSTSGLVPGVYVVRAASADGRSVTRKIVIK